MNALIMAAGLGSRFKEMTKTKHKALLPIAGTPNLERTIRFLNESGIDEIHILTGYLAESFAYLPQMFPGVVLHNNPDFAKYNNIYTFYQGLPYFNDSFVIDGDTVFAKNIFQKPAQSTYFTMVRQEDGAEWCPISDAQGKVVEMKITAEKLPAMTGVTFWSKEDAEKIKAVFSDYLKENLLLNSKGYWDDIPVAMLTELSVTTTQLPQDSIYEMDTQENYYFIEEKFRQNKK
ncbi:NTP transferase domain-containing protein [Enterococcus timonensis]|uniref:NTP transferase domain-containing protein n=1 Tax=Enterococcus timonensis TaxID=1852364 RepID=UPI0008DA899C|nr:NTP transferase domain-containing protein [Enterococcus timonensis]